jgi:hypothetical protein
LFVLLFGISLGGHADSKSFLAVSGSGGEPGQDRTRGWFSGERLAQQKHLQLRMNVQEHERNAALLAVKQAENRLDKLAAENAALQRELEVRCEKENEMLHNLAFRAWHTASH